MPKCFIALGGNLGRVEETFRLILEQLDATSQVKVRNISRVVQTQPMGEHAGSLFLNAAAELETNLDAVRVLSLLQTLENQFGRTRKTRWGPRTVDLDLLLYGPEIIEEPDLMVPHPACWYRRFVLDPLVEIAADVIHPVKHVSIRELHRRLVARPLRCSVAGLDKSARRFLIENLQREFPGVTFSPWLQNSDEPTILVWLGPGCENDDAQNDFESLPQLSRLDASNCEGDVLTFLRDVLDSALGE